MYIYIYIYIYIYMYHAIPRLHTYTHIYKCIHTRTHLSSVIITFSPHSDSKLQVRTTSEGASIYIHTHIHTYIHTYTTQERRVHGTCMPEYIHLYTHTTHTYMHRYTPVQRQHHILPTKRQQIARRGARHRDHLTRAVLLGRNPPPQIRILPDLGHPGRVNHTPVNLPGRPLHRAPDNIHHANRDDIHIEICRGVAPPEHGPGQSVRRDHVNREVVRIRQRPDRDFELVRCVSSAFYMPHMGALQLREAFTKALRSQIRQLACLRIVVFCRLVIHAKRREL